MLNHLLKRFVPDYQNTKDPEVKKAYGLLGSWYGLITNFLLFAGKIAVGILLSMTSVLADAFNNLSDFGNNAIALFGFRLSAKGADKEHPFGHQRMEYIISLVIGCVIIALGGILAYQSVMDLITFFKTLAQEGHPPVSDSLGGDNRTLSFIVTLSILVVAILVKLSQSLFYRALGKRCHSMELIALSKDSRNDVISTFTVIIGLVITWFTDYDVDGFFTLAVSVMVILSGIGIIKEAATVLIGVKPDERLIQEMIDFIRKDSHVLGVHDLMMHTYGEAVYASIHVEMDASLAFLEMHSCVDVLEREVKEKFHISLTIHPDPVVHDEETDLYRNTLEETLKSLPVTLSMHDFRLIKGGKTMNLIFELVVPKTFDSQAKHEELCRLIQESLEKTFTDTKIVLTIDFDEEASDFLSGTNAETRY